MATLKACKHCKNIFSGSSCPKCKSTEATDNYKGKMVILNPENSEIAKNIKIKEKGVYAIKA